MSKLVEQESRHSFTELKHEVFTAFCYSLVQGETVRCHVVGRDVQYVEMARNRFESITHFFYSSRRRWLKRSASFLPVSPMQIFWQSVQVMQQIASVEMPINRSLMSMDRIGAEILLAFWMKGQILHCEHESFEGSWLSALQQCASKFFLITILIDDNQKELFFYNSYRRKPESVFYS